MPINILFADDDSDVHDLVKAFVGEKVKTSDYAAHFFGDGEGLLSYLEKQNPVDIIFLDIQMPGIDGLSVLKKISDDKRIVKVIMMSGDGNFANVREAMNSGAFDFVLKPIRKNDLDITIDKTYRQILTLREANAKIADSYMRLKKMMNQTIQMISIIGELRDPYTAGHQRRVAKLARYIAEELNLPQDDIDGIYISGLLHDVGKIVVPSEILSKPGVLTAHEKSLIQDHAQQGFEILKNIDFLWPVAETVYCHHEKLDGSGYPRGIKGDQISLFARILAVADTFEATGSYRPYRPSLGIGKAIEVCRKSAGHHLDPTIVDTCIRLFEENKITLEALL